MDCLDIEIALMKFFDIRKNIIVPNCYWGLYFSKKLRLNHEADLVILSKSNLATEVEIKVSLQDLKNDFKKSKWKSYKKSGNTINPIFSKMFFAIPETLYEKSKNIIPANIGIITITEEEHKVKIIRKAKMNPKKVKWPDELKIKLLRLGCLRILGLKQKIKTNCISETTDIK